MTIKKGAMVELSIERVAYGGQGVARLNGFVLFVRGAIPGDRVMARVVKKRRDYAEARVVEVLAPSPDRVPAPCPYFGFCGGCQWQHVRYERQLAYKRGYVLEAMGRIGSLPQVRVHETLPSAESYAYRNKMEFSFSDRRWLLPHEYEGQQREKDFALGLHVPGTFHKVIHVEACLLQPEAGNRILREVGKLVKESRIPVYGLRSHRGFWRFLTLRYSTHRDEWMVNLVTSREMTDAVRPLAEALSRKDYPIRTVVNNINTRRAAIAVGERERVLIGEGVIRDRIGPYWFQISANSFFQTNTRGAQKLYEKVLEFAELRGTERVLDLYSGTGTIPIYLSAAARSILGMEIAQSAILDAQVNCALNGAENCHFVLGDIRESLSGLKWRPDLLIIDPPRAGMHKAVLAQVMKLKAEKILYVSCNPTTMARDLGELGQDYRVVEIQPVDMFPQTYHIEAVAKLHRLT